MYREKLAIVAEGATAPETLRQKGPVSTVHSGERHSKVRRRDNDLRQMNRGGIHGCAFLHILQGCR